MNKEHKNKMVPKLRFPEFRDNKGWKEIRLIDVVDKQVKWSFTGGPFGSNLKSSDYTTHGVRIIQLQNIGDGKFIDEYKIFTSKEKAEELLSCNIYPGEIILSKMGDPVGRACLIPDYHSRYLMCSDGIRLVVDKDHFDKYFIYSLINADQFRKLVDKTATGSTRKRIGLDELKNLPMLTPENLHEQQKIADCLSSLDDLIDAETQKLEALQAHKKGLMQNLFPREGETVPRMRFEEFRGGEEWKELELGKVAKFIRGPFGGALKKEIFVKEGYAVYEQVHAIYNDFNTFRYFIDNDKFNELKRFSVHASDIIMSCSGTMGKFAIIPINFKEGVINQALLKLTVFQDYDVEFISKILEMESTQNKLLSQSAGGAIKNVVEVAQIKQIVVRIPTLTEQQKISDFLSSLDNQITSQSDKIEALKLHKKGLMQQLFPSQNAIANL